jgi:hypothetical protein
VAFFQHNVVSLTQVAKAKDAAAISDDNDLDVVGGPVLHDIAEAAALVKAIKVHAERLPAIASTVQMRMISALQERRKDMALHEHGPDGVQYIHSILPQH